MASISLWIGDNCMASTVTTLLDAFSIANLWNRALSEIESDNKTEKESPDLFECRVVTTDGRPATGHGSLTLTPNQAISEVTDTDCVVISPGLPHLYPVPRDIDRLRCWLERLREKGTTIATVCTGAFLLAEMGLLDGKKATTNWQFARLFQKLHPEVNLVPEDMLTEDDNIICAGAATAVYHLGIHLIKKYGSRQLAASCSKALLVDPNRLSQAPYTMSVPLRHHGDDQVLTAQKLIEDRYADIERIDDLAKEVGISPRHFKRRFKKATGELPLKYLQRVRIDAAKELLETTSRPIDAITWAVGYKDISSFCRLFKQHARISPRAYRQKFYTPVAG